MRRIESLSIKEEIHFTKDIGRNADKYAAWLVRRLENVCNEVGVEKKPDQNYRAQAVYVNSRNNEYLNHHLPPLTYLDISPQDDDSLRDDEIAFDMDNILEQGEKNEP